MRVAIRQECQECRQFPHVMQLYSNVLECDHEMNLKQITARKLKCYMWDGWTFYILFILKLPAASIIFWYHEKTIHWCTKKVPTDMVYPITPPLFSCVCWLYVSIETPVSSLMFVMLNNPTSCLLVIYIYRPHSIYVCVYIYAYIHIASPYIPVLLHISPRSPLSPLSPHCLHYPHSIMLVWLHIQVTYPFCPLGWLLESFRIAITYYNYTYSP